MPIILPTNRMISASQTFTRNGYKQWTAQGGITPPPARAPVPLRFLVIAPGDKGEIAYYILRWINATGDPGPWGPF